MRITLTCPECHEKIKIAPEEILLASQLVADGSKYVLDMKEANEVGRGDMTAVFKVTDKETREPYAIKVLLEPFRSRKHFVSEFEAHVEFEKTSNKDSHREIYKIYECKLKPRKSGNLPYFLMPFYAGGNLKTELERKRENGEKITVDNILRWGVDICVALRHLHGQNTTHGNLKLENILLDRPDVDSAHAVVMDSAFGWTTKDIFCDQRFVSPEQLSNKTVEPRSDIYSLGVVLYSLTRGEEPAARIDHNEILRMSSTNNHSIHDGKDDDWLNKVIAKCLADFPDQRYKTVTDVLEDLNKGDFTQKVTSDLPKKEETPTEVKRFKTIMGLAVLTLALIFYLTPSKNTPDRKDNNTKSDSTSYQQTPNSSAFPGKFNFIPKAKGPDTSQNWVAIGGHVIILPDQTPGSPAPQPQPSPVPSHPVTPPAGHVHVDMVAITAPAGNGQSNQNALRDVFVSRKEITQAQYRTVMRQNPSTVQVDALPVDNVSWTDAALFCNRLSQNESLQKCFDMNNGTCDITRNGYRLPLETEWERACGNMAFADCIFHNPSNQWEWCLSPLDRYGNWRVARGGQMDSAHPRPTDKIRLNMSETIRQLGFRVVRNQQ